MPPLNPFHEAKPLKFFIEHLAGSPRWSWLYIANVETTVSFDTLCWPAATNSRDLSEEEVEAFDEYVTSAGLRSFLNRDQLEDVIENLRSQASDFIPSQLSAAIDFYWRQDAFINLTFTDE